MYNVYLIYLYLIFICHISFYCIYRHYESTPNYIPIHHVMHTEYGNKALLLLFMEAFKVSNVEKLDSFMIYLSWNVSVIFGYQQLMVWMYCSEVSSLYEYKTYRIDWNFWKYICYKLFICRNSDRNTRGCSNWAMKWGVFLILFHRLKSSVKSS